MDYVYLTIGNCPQMIKCCPQTIQGHWNYLLWRLVVKGLAISSRFRRDANGVEKRYGPR